MKQVSFFVNRRMKGLLSWWDDMGQRNGH